jgi:hypothetical protein
VSGLDSSAVVYAAIVGVGIALLLFVALFSRLRNRQRDARLAQESTQSDEERAFNQIQIVRASLEHLEKQGFDVGAVRALLSEAQGADERGDHAGALSTVTRAKEKLLQIRNSAAGGDPTPGGTGLASPAGAALSGAPAPEGAPDGESPARPRLPPHQVEARFEMTALSADLAHAGPSVSAENRAEAQSLFGQAHSAYDRREYAEAWRLALRGRRRLGTPLETVAASPATVTTSPDPTAQPPETPTPDTRPCPTCGRASRSGDQYCRSCGAALRGAKCPRCGTKMDPADRFCPGCGTPSGS